jgi:GntR family transcriptional regulator
MDFQSKKAIYLQIADYVCEQILLEKWKNIEKIPSVRELAITLEVNPNTVMRTYSYLEEKKIIATQRGIGYFVREDAYQHVVALKKAELMETDLPKLFRSMDLLQIDFDKIKQLYKERMNYEKK